MLVNPSPFRGSAASAAPKRKSASPDVSKRKKVSMVDKCKKQGKRTIKFSTEKGMVQFCGKMIDKAKK